MSVISSDGLSLSVGDGATTESFLTLPATSRIEIDLEQMAEPDTSIQTDIWQRHAMLRARVMRLMVEALASSDGAIMRIRTLALGGIIGNFHLRLSPGENFYFTASVSHYREQIRPGNIKALTFQLLSTGPIAVA